MRTSKNLLTQKRGKMDETKSLLEIGDKWGFNALLIVFLLGLFALAFRFLLNLHKGERNEFREVLERQHKDILEIGKESNKALAELSKAVNTLADRRNYARNES